MPWISVNHNWKLKTAYGHFFIIWAITHFQKLVSPCGLISSISGMFKAVIKRGKFESFPVQKHFKNISKLTPKFAKKHYTDLDLKRLFMVV